MEENNEDLPSVNGNHEELENSDKINRVLNGVATEEDLIWYNTLCNSLQNETLVSNFGQIQSRMFEQINYHIDRKPILNKLNIYRITAAAVVLLALSAGLFFYMNKAPLSNNIVVLKGPDVTPGKNSARLTLSNGHQIILSGSISGQLTNESGVSVSKTADGRLIYEIIDKPEKALASAYNTLTTVKGEQYQVRLPDGSTVWLNAASSLKYPVSFASVKQRKVELDGEAYFEVAKDKKHPFIVSSKGQQIEVLGTHFNINSYADEVSTKTTLLEGSVQINGHVFIKPGEQATGAGNQIEVSKADTEAAVDWKNGDFIFNKNDDFKSAMRKIARWYDVDIIYESSAYTGMELRGWLSRKNTLSVVLQRIESTGKVHFKIEGRRVTVTK